MLVDDINYILKYYGKRKTVWAYLTDTKRFLLKSHRQVRKSGMYAHMEETKILTVRNMLNSKYKAKDRFRL